MKMTKTQELFVKLLAVLKEPPGLDEADIVGTVVMMATDEAIMEMTYYIEEEYEKGTLTRDKLVAKVHDIVQTC